MFDNNYIYIIVPFISLIMAQLIKFIIESLKNKKLMWGRLFSGSGGMPSSHTSFCFSLTMLVGFKNGFDSNVFAICLVFSCIVMFDALGLRKESGHQAVAINKILDEIFSKDTKDGVKHLTEQLGHNPVEVLAGIILGTIVAYIFYSI